MSDEYELSSDRALSDPDDDKFGVAPFAAMLAKSIQQHTSADGLVIALHGPWGSGKTTVLRFVRHYLSQSPPAEQPVIVEFNPWWFSGGRGLTGRFFEALMIIVRKWKTRGGNLTDSLTEFALAVSEAPIPGAGYAKSARLLQRPKDIQKARETLASELRKQAKRTLVIVDDIDRLTADEIRELFKVIKAVGDLPHVMYLLAFDREMAAQALTSIQGTPGEDYLDKIIQVPFDLPLPDRVSLRDFFVSRLNSIIASTEQSTFDPVRWANVFADGIDEMLQSPRDVTRFTNTLSVTYPAVLAKVNPIDFIGVEALRVFAPQVYDLVRRSKSYFAGAYDAREKDVLERFHNQWVEKLSENEPTQSLVRRLFPKVDAAFGGQVLGDTFQSKWRRDLQVCSPERFDVYFRLAVPAWDISTPEMLTIFDLASDPARFGALLKSFKDVKSPDGISKLRRFLDHMLDYTDTEIPKEKIGLIIRAFADVGDELDERAFGMFDSDNSTRIGRVLWRLLSRQDQKDNLAALIAAVTAGRALATIVHWLIVLEQEHGRYGETTGLTAERRHVDEAGLASLEELALGRIRDAAKDRSIYEVGEQLPMILRHWASLVDNDEVKRWTTAEVEDDAQLVRLVASFLSLSYNHGMGDRVGSRESRLNPKWLESFIDIDTTAKRLRELQDGLPPNLAVAIRQYLTEYDLLQSGKDPDDPFSFLRD
jgi:predicted KAP-like P-loop ATPase